MLLKKLLTGAATATPIACASTLALSQPSVIHAFGAGYGSACFAGGYLAVAGLVTADPFVGFVGGILLVACL